MDHCSRARFHTYRACPHCCSNAACCAGVGYIRNRDMPPIQPVSTDSSRSPKGGNRGSSPPWWRMGRPATDPMNERIGKSALVTGGSRGIGAATAVALAERGADIAFTYKSSEDPAARVVKEI